MSNPAKGEVDLPIGNKTYVLCFGANAIVEVETLFDSDILSIMRSMQGATRLGTLRGVLWGGLRKHHPDLSLFDVGDMLDEAGVDGMADLGAKLGEAIRFRLSGSGAGSPAKPAARPRK